ncbi:MAG: hypothetical protein ABI662_09985 [Dermatophilaceae bacterium]
MTLPWPDLARTDAPLRGRAWPPWAWILLVLTSAVGSVLTTLVTAFEKWGLSSTCNDPPSPDRIHAGERELAVLCAIVLVPWLLAAVWARPRARVVVAGLVCASPAIIAILNGALNPNAFRGSFCF